VSARVRRARALAGLLLAATLFAPRPLTAHQFAPALLELQELEPGQAAVRWKQPAVRVQGSRLRPVLPGSCQGVGKPTVTRAGAGILARWEITCPAGLVGKTLGVEGIATSRADVLLRIALADGRSFRRVLTADQPSFLVPGVESKLGVVRGYTRLGVEHIVTGWDHLLFVLGLVLLVGRGRTLLWTITAFTIGHSITLALASLGLMRVPQGPMEAAIAFSIYLLAVELVRSRAGQASVVQRAPWLVAGPFGLLHGLGFAGALAEVGLPQGEIPLALFAFNMGIELGQLAFVAVALVAMATLRGLPVRWPRWAPALPGYAIGSLAIYWFLERLAREVTLRI
jgi:hydrogenase/urease accessory protein HupE